MGVRVWLLFLLVLGASWTCANSRGLVISDLLSRDLVISEVSVMQINYLVPKKEIQAIETVAKDNKVCTLCEEFTSQALIYLGENKTQTEIIDILHHTCSQMHSFKQECITLVDYYAPLVFLEITNLQPEDFCQKVNLCEQMAIASPQHQDSCGLCHHAVAEVLVKLKDPEIQLEILELLLKGCDTVENYVKQCKKLVFEYGPLIMANAEQFLENTDLCTTFHACKASTAASEHASSSLVEVSLLSEA